MEGSIIVHTPARHFETEDGIESEAYWGEVFAVGAGGWGLLRFFCKHVQARTNRNERWEVITRDDQINLPLITVRKRRGGEETTFTVYSRPDFTVVYQVPVDQLPEDLVVVYGQSIDNRLVLERQLYQQIRERREEREQNAEHYRPIRGFAFLDTDDHT